ncbi:cytochrome P450 4c21 [Halyomorpha halys]|uniref:cytochrome P450 4c21 n=1 Tax=Halyomorpha halys TaxID=286706 RepID=UPI0006D4C8CC|nr:cytochrome P450 4e3-like [Halyomorpha halys]
MEMFVVAVLIVVLAHLTLGVILWLRVRKLYSYPGLLGFPVIGNLYYFYRTLFLCTMCSMNNYLSKVAEKYGENGLCFHWVYGFRRAVIITSPHVIKDIGFHPNLSVKPGFMYGGLYPYMDGPFAATQADELWKTKRKEHITCLKKSHVDSEYFNSFVKSADKLVDLMLASPNVDAHHTTIQAINGVTMKTLFGFETNIVEHPMVTKIMMLFVDIASITMATPKLIGYILAIIRPLDFLVSWEFSKLRKLILKMVNNAVMSNPSPLPEPCLSVLITKRNRKNNGSDTTLMNEFQEMFLASAHTTGSALSNSIICLALQPDMQERAWKEQYEIFGNDKRDPSIDDIQQMQFLDRLIKECMRFVGPVFLGKLTTGDIDINGITIPSDTCLVFLMNSMRMDPKYCNNPNVFDPDRFLEESNTLKYSCSPYGVGVRSCPGVYFSTLLMKITFSKIIRRLKLRPLKKDLRFEDIQFKDSLLREAKIPCALLVEERA